ncbi:hypothetical protein PENTCL1PPCAC_5168, partial [Pristionchus entomophagus]
VHPRYGNRDFFITGESYAGVYIPYLAREILNQTALGVFENTYFKGIAMGNAAVDYFSNYFSEALQLYSMGIIEEKHGKKIFELWEQILRGERPDKKELERISGIVTKQLGVKPLYDLKSVIVWKIMRSGTLPHLCATCSVLSKISLKHT